MLNPLQRFMFWCYLLFMHLLSPVWRYMLHRRLQRGKETPYSIAQKCSVTLPERPNAPIIWGHAVGVGEVLALAGLFATLSKRLPDHYFLITSIANTSGEVLKKGQLPARCIHQFVPLDTPKTIQTFLNHWKPTMAIWCELDLWPGLIYCTHRLNIPMYLVNARLSKASAQRKKRAKFFYQALLNCFKTIYCQNHVTESGFIRLGVRSTQLEVNGSIKALAQPLKVNSTQLIELKQRLHERPCWLIASSHEGEEAIALTAHALIRQTVPNALLLIAPRYPKRGNALAQTYQLTNVQRSQGHSFSDQDSVYLCDTIGEMGLWYSLSSIALVGGSIVKVGGHNPYEPLLLNCAVLHGPHVDNFKEIYEDLTERDLAQLVHDETQIAQAVIKTFTSDTDYGTMNQGLDLNQVFEPMLNNLVLSAKQ
jgi:3-deoxy-D-manno-octulosonic-acid transferase